MRMRPRMLPPHRLPPPPMRPMGMGPPFPGMMRPPAFRGPPMRPPLRPHMMRPGPHRIRPPPPHFMRHPMSSGPHRMRPPPPHFMRPPMPPGHPPPFMVPQGPRIFRGGPSQRPSDQIPIIHPNAAKRKRVRLPYFNLSNPWVTDAIREEFFKKDQLLSTAMTSLQQPDLAAYRVQRDKCTKVYGDAKVEYNKHQPEEGYIMDDEQLCGEEEILDAFEDQQDKVCNTCEREFYTFEQYQKHMSKHRTCGIDGCSFTAHEKIVEHHIEMQHISGLYDRMRNLTTPEDISKWVEDRKKNFPSKENIEKRYKRQEEMFKRGERLGHTKSRFDHKNKTRYALNKSNRKPLNSAKTVRKTKKAPKGFAHEAKSVSLIDEHADWNGTMFPFRGTTQLFNKEQSSSSDEFEDDEWEQKSAPSNGTNKIAITNALGSLMCAYNSSDECDEEMQETPIPIPQHITKVSDDEPPEEQPIKREQNNIDTTTFVDTTIVEQAEHEKYTTDRKRKRCHRKNGRKSQNVNGIVKTQAPKNTIFKKRKVTLLERLLSNEIKHERNVILQCIRYVVTNNFFDKKVCDITNSSANDI